MNYINWLLHKLLSAKILTICVMTITIGVTQAAYPGYQPPPDQKPPTGYSDSSGIR